METVLQNPLFTPLLITLVIVALAIRPHGLLGTAGVKKV